MEDPRPKASPVNVYGRGEGLLANMQAGRPLIMIVYIDMLHIIKGKHPSSNSVSKKIPLLTEMLDDEYMFCDQELRI